MPPGIDWQSVIAAIIGSGILLAVVGWINGRTARDKVATDQQAVITQMAANAIEAVKSAEKATTALEVMKVEFAAEKVDNARFVRIVASLKRTMAANEATATARDASLETKLTETASECKARIEGLERQIAELKAAVVTKDATIARQSDELAHAHTPTPNVGDTKGVVEATLTGVIK